MHESVISLAAALAADTSNQFQWVQIATGIIGIPAGILGLYATWVVANKTRLETRNIPSGAKKKKKKRDPAAAKASNGPANTAEIVAEPILHTERVQNIILRAILISLILVFWDLIRVMLSDLLPGAGIFVLSFGDILSTIYWLIVIAMGWPLMIDALRLLRVDVPQFLQSRTARWLIMLLVAFILLTSAWRRELINS
jgi:predicted histidine transporter YuiF (NhaC family)